MELFGGDWMKVCSFLLVRWMFMFRGGFGVRVRIILVI
jgi:hypothetical protein